MRNLLVITDLDGSLLDHHDYSFAAALPALNRLHELDIPVILNSSKTRDEMLECRSLLGNHFPFIVENGSALYLTDNKGQPLRCIPYGLSRNTLISRFREINSKHRFSCLAFSEMQTERVAELTGLTLEQAARAMQREFTEPLLWLDSEENLKRFRSLMAEAGINTVRGGRFVHLSGQATKACGMDYLRKDFAVDGKPPLVIALGDSENDLPMLQIADFPVLIRSPVRDFPEFEHPQQIRTTEYGPAGWNSAVLQILEQVMATAGIS